MVGGAFLRQAVALLGWLAWGAAAFASIPDAAVALAPQGSLALTERTQALLPRAAGTTPERFVTAPAQQGPAGVAALDETNELWIRLAVRNPTVRAGHWHLEVLLPSADVATLYQRQGAAWGESSAGDRVPISQWPLAGRFASFPLHLEAGEARTLVLRVRNAFPVPVPLRISAESAVHRQHQAGSVGFGLVLGALALLVASCVAQAALYRELRYFLYAMFALLLGLSFGALSGIAGQHLWGDWVEWNDRAKTTLPLLAAGVNVWLVSALCSLRTRARPLRRFVVAVGALIVLLAVAFSVAGVLWRPAAAGGFVVAGFAALAVAYSTWRRGDPIGGWVLAGYAPLVAVTLLVVARTLGLAPFDFDGAPWLAASIGLMLPLLMMALHLRSKETLALQLRNRDLEAMDPLTGLLGPALFLDRVRAAVARFERSGHDAVVLYVRVANYSRIREVHGAGVADQSMIRCAIKVQRLMSEADCIGRVAEDTIALILEYDTDRAAVQERAAQLIAHGLMAPKGLKPELILQLHVVANVLSAYPMQAAAMHDSLSEVLRAMSARTRKPIRFLEPPAADEPTVPEEADPELPAAA